jgi:tyrosyl-DNA phosphodiesterase-1
MTPSNGSNVPPAKRRKLDDTATWEAEGTDVTSASLTRPVSPPVSRRKPPTPAAAASTSLLVPAPTWGFDDVSKQTLTPPPSQPTPSFKTANQSAAQQTEESKREEEIAGYSTRYIPSPFQLTKIRDLAPHQNVDTVELKDILGDPLIKECWNFNFLFDLDFVM